MSVSKASAGIRYFVYTVFTTVGFGDITPSSNGEMVFVILLMMIGAVVNSLIVSEVTEDGH